MFCSQDTYIYALREDGKKLQISISSELFWQLHQALGVSDLSFQLAGSISLRCYSEIRAMMPPSTLHFSPKSKMPCLAQSQSRRPSSSISAPCFQIPIYPISLPMDVLLFVCTYEPESSWVSGCVCLGKDPESRSISRLGLGLAD